MLRRTIDFGTPDAATTDALASLRRLRLPEHITCRVATLRNRVQRGAASIATPVVALRPASLTCRLVKR
jgi:hypothetical protein